MRRIVVLAAIVAMMPAVAAAQWSAFTAAARDLAAAAATADDEARTTAIRAAAVHMRAALAGWDREIRAVEIKADHELRGSGDERAFQLHVQLGLAYLARGRAADARRELDAAVMARPTSSDVQLLRADALDMLGRPTEATAAVRTAWGLDPGNAAKAYRLLHRPDAATADERRRARAVWQRTYDRIVGTPVPSPSAALAHPFLVVDAIPDSLSEVPAIADPSTQSAFALLRARRYADAIDALLDTPGRNAGSSLRVAFERARIAEAENRIADARRDYHAALAGALTGRVTLSVALARLAQVDGDLDAAVEALTRAIQIDPNNPRLHEELAGVFVAQGRPDEAFAELVIALLVQPANAPAYRTLGQLFLDADRPADAVVALEHALAAAPEQFETRYALATALERAGRGEDGARELARFEAARRDALERRRQQLTDDVAQQEAIRRRHAAGDVW